MTTQMNTTTGGVQVHTTTQSALLTTTNHEGPTVESISNEVQTTTPVQKLATAVSAPGTSSSDFGSSTEGADSKRKTVVIVSIDIPIMTIVILALVIVTAVCVAVYRKRHRRLTFISVNSDAEAYYTPLISSNEDIELVDIDK